MMNVEIRKDEKSGERTQGKKKTLEICERNDKNK